MKKVVIVLVFLGVIASVGLGATWISDYNSYKSEIDTIKDLADSVGGDAGLQDSITELDKIRNAGYALLVGAVVALITVFLLGKLKKIGAGIILLTGIAPAIFDPSVLVFTFLLVLAGILAFFIKPKAVATVVN